MKKRYSLLMLMLCVATQRLNAQDTILIIDYGSPITPDIALCLQQIQIQSQTCWYSQAEEFLKEIKPKGIILAGGPESVIDLDSPRAPECVFTADVPVLGICYGQQLMCIQLGGSVVPGVHPEHGETLLHITGSCALTQNLWQPGSKATIWMGHEDCIDVLPEGFKSIAHTAGSLHAIIADDERKFYGVQFHPEVQDIKEGHGIIHAFVCDIVEAQPDPTLVPPKYRSPFKAPALLHDCCGRKIFKSNFNN